MANPTTSTNCASNNSLSNNSQSYIIMLAAASKKWYRPWLVRITIVRLKHTIDRRSVHSSSIYEIVMADTTIELWRSTIVRLSTSYHRPLLLCNNVGRSFKEVLSAAARTNYHRPPLRAQLQRSAVDRPSTNYHRPWLLHNTVGYGSYESPSSAYNILPIAALCASRMTYHHPAIYELQSAISVPIWLTIIDDDSTNIIDCYYYLIGM